MSDRIFLHGMVFEGRHGVTEEERESAQQIEVDLDVELDLRAAGATDDLARTVDYGDLFDACRRVVEERSYHLLEGIAEAIASDVLGGFPTIDGLICNVTKPGAPLAGLVEHAGVRIERRR